MKRVYCLYRVSTKKQVDKNENDIPMQKTACHEFAGRQTDWVIQREFSEKGISGYKVSAQDRDAIQDLKEAALKGEFDILLVFMFDRIGRIDDETPFVVEWFAKHGIEVWSAREGQQRFDNHVDKLMNYLRFWQASGESEKTSIRISSKMQQMQSEGLYTGGPVKFGYCLVDSGLVNRKGAPIQKYEIDPMEQEILAMIDEMTVQKGYGAWRLADLLNKEGHKTRSGEKFTGTKISRILKDPYYCGRLEDGSTSDALQALRLRSNETYDRIMYIMEQRSKRNEEKRHVAMHTKGRALLSGNIFCAHCGGRLISNHYTDSYERADGSVYRVDQIKYSCYHKSRKLCPCDGQTTYQAEKVDGMVCQIIREIFKSMSGAPEEEKIQDLFQRRIAGNRAMQKKLNFELGKHREQLTKLQMEIAKTLTGDSVYSPEDLTQAIQTVKKRIEESETQLEKLKEEETQKKQGIDMVTPAYKQFKSWAEEFDTATMEQRKMIACQLLKRVEVGRDYKISVELNMTYSQFCTEWNANEFLDTLLRPAVQMELQKAMFKRRDGLCFLPEMIVNAEQDSLLRSDNILRMLDKYGCIVVDALYKRYSLSGENMFLRDGEDFEDYLLFLMPNDIRIANKLGNKVVRRIDVSFEDVAQNAAQKVVKTIRENQCITQEEILSTYPMFSETFLRKLLEKYADEVVVIKINDYLCYQTIESLGIDSDFSANLYEVLDEIRRISLMPSQDIIHALLSVRLGYNICEELGIPDDKTFRHIISMYYTGERQRTWKAGSFVEADIDYV